MIFWPGRKAPDSGHPRLWTAGLRDAAPARELTADTGRAAFYQSEYDLVIAEGRLHWVANGPARETELRSVALTGGPVEVRTEAGTWALSAWPWQIDGVDGSAGTTTVRNIATGKDCRGGQLAEAVDRRLQPHLVPGRVALRRGSEPDRVDAPGRQRP